MNSSNNPITHEKAVKLRKKYPHTNPSVIRNGFVFGVGYRCAYGLGNVIQAKVAKELGIQVVLAQQSARELERTGRTYENVIDLGAYSSQEANLTIPWSADGDHLKTEEHIKAAVAGGCTHFTYDVSNELKKSIKEAVEQLTKLINLTAELKKGKDFTVEVSFDETEYTTKFDEVIFALEELKKRKIKVDELAPRFPGFFEKAIDYYLEKRDDKNTVEFERYLIEILKILNKYGVRLCVHSGSDKFSIYPILAKHTKNNYHLKSAGTYYLEELRIVAKHNPDLFKEIYAISMKQFEKDRASYELSTNTKNIPEISKLKGEDIFALLDTKTGNGDLRQLLHVTYGSILTVDRFFNGCFEALKNHSDEHYEVFKKHIKLHVDPCFVL
ncbi:MAG: tagaturonate epimerase family protein [Elusimicrobia bacterium]|nr:tagaturonate epimerase family protein [Elusimicrobiota bacterium]MBU2614663.1 tagaturonate epimerase family protein [Elusimicrobiota bacterium]